MAKTKAEKGLGCCRVEAVVTVDERGQMVLPKDLRERADIAPGDKLVVISSEKEKKVCCFHILKSKDFSDQVKDFLGPLMNGLFN